MTSEELIIGLRYIANMMKRNRLPYHQRVAEEAIKELEQRGSVWEIAYERGKVEVLDKLTSEIERHRRKTESIDTYDLVGDCLDFINKYKGEQNET